MSIHITKRTATRIGVVAVVAAAGAALAAPTVFAEPAAQARPDFQLPFACGDTWEGNTRQDHSPELSVDLRGSGIDGVDVIASAPGTVAHVEDRGNESYGKVVFIEHEGDWFTTYAHLSKWTIKEGDKVDHGDKIGEVGSTGGSTGPHLHFEERTGEYLGNVEKVTFDGEEVLYYGDKNYKSKNGC